MTSWISNYDGGELAGWPRQLKLARGQGRRHLTDTGNVKVRAEDKVLQRCRRVKGVEDSHLLAGWSSMRWPASSVPSGTGTITGTHEENLT